MMKKAFKHNCMIRPMFFPPSLSSANAGVDMELRQCFVSTLPPASYALLRKAWRNFAGSAPSMNCFNSDLYPCVRNTCTEYRVRSNDLLCLVAVSIFYFS